MEDLFDKLSAVTGITKYSGSEVITPKWIVSDMVDLLPTEVFAPDSRFLDPAVKSGRFLIELHNRLMDSPLMVQAFPDEKDRHEHIIHNQLFGFATSAVAATIVRKALYNDATILGNIVYTADKVTKELIQGAFGIMKFDVVIGNPPYNNDIYLDFVVLGHNLASQCTCMITPAKWQAKGGKKNEDFRKNIVPYMSKIVYYPNTPDVFCIGEAAGISYYIIDKVERDDLELVSKCKINGTLNGQFNGGKSEIKALELCGKSIIDKMPTKKIDIKSIDYSKKHKVFANNLVGLSGGGGNWETCLFSKDAKTNFLGKCSVTHSLLEEQHFSHNYTVVFSALTSNECDSFVSYINTKLTRFLLYCGRCGNSVTNKETWRFVPDPGAFDHIFTDQELYDKYGLTDEEINIIESVIKERK